MVVILIVGKYGEVSAELRRLVGAESEHEDFSSSLLTYTFMCTRIHGTAPVDVRGLLMSEKLRSNIEGISRSNLPVLLPTQVSIR